LLGECLKQWLYMLWFNFYFPLFYAYYQPLPCRKTEENKHWTKDKIEPQHAHKFPLVWKTNNPKKDWKEPGLQSQATVCLELKNHCLKFYFLDCGRVVWGTIAHWVIYRLYQRTQSSINPYLMSKVRIVCHVSLCYVSRFILLASNANDKFHVLSYQYYFVLKYLQCF